MTEDAEAALEAAEGAEWIADQMTKAGAARFHDWAMQELPLVVALDSDKRKALAACTPDDLETGALFLEGEAAREYQDDQELAAGLRKLAAAARERGLTRVADLGDLPAQS
jgi:hypothetical protein